MDIQANQAGSAVTRRKMRALLLGDRIDTSGLERTDVLSTAPLAFRAGQAGTVTVFRYGVIVLCELSVLEEDEVLRGLRSRVVRPIEPHEDETAIIEVSADKDEQILPGGPILLRTASLEHILVIADALAKSVVLARDEREVSSVIEVTVWSRVKIHLGRRIARIRSDGPIMRMFTATAELGAIWRPA